MAGDPKLVELKAKYISLKAKILCFTTYCICCEFLGIIAGLMELLMETSNLRALKTLRVTRAFKTFTGVILIDTIFILVVLIYLYKLVKKDGDVKKLKTCRIILSVIFVL